MLDLFYIKRTQSRGAYVLLKWCVTAAHVCCTCANLTHWFVLSWHTKMCRHNSVPCYRHTSVCHYSTLVCCNSMSVTVTQECCANFVQFWHTSFNSVWPTYFLYWLLPNFKFKSSRSNMGSHIYFSIFLLTKVWVIMSHYDAIVTHYESSWLTLVK